MKIAQGVTAKRSDSGVFWKQHSSDDFSWSAVGIRSFVSLTEICTCKWLVAAFSAFSKFKETATRECLLCLRLLLLLKVHHDAKPTSQVFPNSDVRLQPVSELPRSVFCLLFRGKETKKKTHAKACNSCNQPFVMCQPTAEHSCKRPLEFRVETRELKTGPLCEAKVSRLQQ